MHGKHYIRNCHHIAFALCCILLAQTCWAGVVLKGLIKQNAADGAPLASVLISADGANQAKTDASGHFSMKFPAKQAGEEVSLVISGKLGWKVLHELMLKRLLPKEGGQEAEIILCKIDECDRLALNYFRLKSVAAVEKDFAYRIGVLEGKLGANQAEIAALKNERDKALAQAADLAEQFAKVPRRGTTVQYREAWQLYLDGELEQALTLLNEMALAGMDAENEKNAQLARSESANSWLLRGELLILRGDFSLAAKAYEKAIALDPAAYDVWVAYANFHIQLKHFAQAKKGFEKSLELARIAKNDADVAAFLNNLGLLHRNENRLREAHDEYAESLAIYRKLAHKNPDAYLKFVASTLSNMGVLFFIENRLADALNAYDESLGIRRKLSKKNPAMYLPGVANVLGNIGNLHRVEKRFLDAQSAYEEALTIRRMLAKSNPDENLSEIATGLANLGLLHYTVADLKKARNEFAESLQIFRKLAMKNPDTHLPDVARLLGNFGVLYRDESRLPEARHAYNESLAIYRQLTQINTEAYAPDMAGVLLNLANLNFIENHLPESRVAVQEALTIYRSFNEKNPRTFSREIAICEKQIALIADKSTN